MHIDMQKSRNYSKYIALFLHSCSYESFNLPFDNNLVQGADNLKKKKGKKCNDTYLNTLSHQREIKVDCANEKGKEET